MENIENFTGTIAREINGSWSVYHARDGELTKRFIVDEWRRDEEVVEGEILMADIEEIDEQGSKRTYIE